MRRRTADITAAYIEDTANVLNKFLEKPIQLLYMKGDIKQGIVDVKVGDADEFKRKKLMYAERFTNWIIENESVDVINLIE